MISKEWQATDLGKTPIEVWQNKIRHIRLYLRGWARHRSGIYKKEKERLLGIIDCLDIKAETNPLNPPEREALRKANESLSKLRREE